MSSVKGQHGGPTPSTPLNCLCPVAIRPWEGSHCRLSRLFVPTNQTQDNCRPLPSPYPWTHNDLSCPAPTPNPLCLVSSTSHLLPTFQVPWVLYWFDWNRGYFVHRNQGGTFGVVLKAELLTQECLIMAKSRSQSPKDFSAPPSAQPASERT